MPIRRRIVRRKRARVVRRRVSRKTRTAPKYAITKQLSAIPDRLFTKLRYCDVASVTIASGLLINPLTYRSSLFDPKSGSAHQPLTFDQYAPAMYSTYRVMGMKYHITVINSKINETWFASVEHENDTNVVATTSLQTLFERQIAKVRIGGQQYSPSNRVYLKGYMSVAKTMGVPLATVKDDDKFSAYYNVAPARFALLNLYMSHNNVSSQTFDVITRITYYCCFENRVWFSAS